MTVDVEEFSFNELNTLVKLRSDRNVEMMRQAEEAANKGTNKVDTSNMSDIDKKAYAQLGRVLTDKEKLVHGLHSKISGM